MPHLRHMNERQHMSLKSSKAYNDSYERLLADSIRRCKITGVRCIDGEAKDGKPRMDQDWITFSLEEPAKSVDGEELAPGFFKDVSINTYPNGTDGNPKQENANRMNMALQRKLIVCALGLPANCKDAAEELERRGGLDALAGKVVLVKFQAKDGRQNVQDILPVPAATAGT